MHVNAVVPVALFVVLMVAGLLASYLTAVLQGDVQAWIPYIRSLDTIFSFLQPWPDLADVWEVWTQRTSGGGVTT